MKKNIFSLFSLFILFAVQNLMAQCHGDRYKTILYSTSELMIYKDIKYGTNYTYDATKGQNGYSTQDYAMDIYTPPLLDTVINRPVLFFTHGGTFLNGTKADKDMVHLCKQFARRGYVTVSIDYRLGFEQPIDSIKATRAVYRALQDGRAAVRFLRANASTYKIDVNRIYFGGMSAGALIAINMAYLNKPFEVPTYVDTSTHSQSNPLGLDGIEGKTNDLKTSSKINGIINLCGATGKVKWMDDLESQLPIISMHGTADSTVPYGTAIIRVAAVSGTPKLNIIKVDGSYTIHKHAKQLGIPNAFYTWCNAPHVPFYDSSKDSVIMVYMDSVENFLNKQIYELFLKCGTTDGIESNVSCWDKNTSVENSLKVESINIYPNPFSNELKLEGLTMESKIEMYNSIGKLIFSKQYFGESINTEGLPKGLYILKVSDKENQKSLKLLK